MAAVSLKASKASPLAATTNRLASNAAPSARGRWRIWAPIGQRLENGQAGAADDDADAADRAEQHRQVVRRIGPRPPKKMMICVGAGG